MKSRQLFCKKAVKLVKFWVISQRLYSLYKVIDDKMYEETAFYINLQNLYASLLVKCPRNQL